MSAGDADDVAKNDKDEKEETPEVLKDLALEIYDVIRDIRDPEKPETLGELEVIGEDSVFLRFLSSAGKIQTDDFDSVAIRVTFTPTVPHCSLATLIGLCIRMKIVNFFGRKHKLEIIVKSGSHAAEGDVNKQINDKERVAAAMENESLKRIVDGCIGEAE